MLPPSKFDKNTLKFAKKQSWNRHGVFRKHSSLIVTVKMRVKWHKKCIYRSVWSKTEAAVETTNVTGKKASEPGRPTLQSAVLHSTITETMIPKYQHIWHWNYAKCATTPKIHQNTILWSLLFRSNRLLFRDNVWRQLLHTITQTGQTWASHS